MKQDYDQKLVDGQLGKVDKLVRDDLQQEKDQEQKDPKRIPLILLTYSRFLQNLTAVAHKTGTFAKPTKIYENYSKNTQSQPLRETNI